MADENTAAPDRVTGLRDKLTRVAQQAARLRESAAQRPARKPPAPRTRAKPSTATRRGRPGTEFHNLALQLGIRDKPSCSCKALRRDMDRLGVAGCRAQRDRLLSVIRQNYQQVTSAEKVMAAARAVSSGLALTINPLDPVGSLFDEAVRRAEAAESNPSSAAPVTPLLPPGVWDDYDPQDEEVRRRFAEEWHR